MTPTEIETSARRRYNAVGDTGWSSQEIVDLIREGCLEIVRDCGLVIEKRFELTTTIGLGEYAFPEHANGIRRIQYNGKKLRNISMREDDTLTLENQLATDTGDTDYYWTWDRTIYLRPLPASAVLLEVFALCSEQTLTINSVIDVPAVYHGSLVTFVVKEMASKDLNWKMFDRYDEKWNIDKQRIQAHIRRSKRADSFAIVKNEESMPYSTLGVK